MTPPVQRCRGCGGWEPYGSSSLLVIRGTVGMLATMEFHYDPVCVVNTKTWRNIVW